MYVFYLMYSCIFLLLGFMVYFGFVNNSSDSSSDHSYKYIISTSMSSTWVDDIEYVDGCVVGYAHTFTKRVCGNYSVKELIN